MPEEMKIIYTVEMPEEQIWGKNVMFYEKKLYRDDKIAINIRRVPPQKRVQSEEGYQLHTHGDSMEILFPMQGKTIGYHGDRGEELGEGERLVVIPPGTKHGLVTVEEELRALVIFIPPPKERY